MQEGLFLLPEELLLIRRIANEIWKLLYRPALSNEKADSMGQNAASHLAHYITQLMIDRAEGKNKLVRAAVTLSLDWSMVRIPGSVLRTNLHDKRLADSLQTPTPRSASKPCVRGVRTYTRVLSATLSVDGGCVQPSCVRDSSCIAALEPFLQQEKRCSRWGTSLGLSWKGVLVAPLYPVSAHDGRLASSGLG